MRSIYILGTRGIPAAHGGFETFAQELALHMVALGWHVTVYCQAEDTVSGFGESSWRGVHLRTTSAPAGALGTMIFDAKCVLDCLSSRGVKLVLGYNTALFSAILRINGSPLLTNMDGVEWRRDKWSLPERAWLYLNEIVGAMSSTKLIADHPDIADHLRRLRKGYDIVTIPYGAHIVTDADDSLLEPFGLKSRCYALSIGRIEPENNILQMVEAYVESGSHLGFVCLGRLTPSENSYHRKIVAASQGRVIFPGAIYDERTVQALRFHCAVYCHGHSVGGTNPSLVEALAAGNAVIAHDNKFNRWVAGSRQFYFNTQSEFSAALETVESAGIEVAQARVAAREQFDEKFRWAPILDKYEKLCCSSLRASK